VCKLPGAHYSKSDSNLRHLSFSSLPDRHEYQRRKHYMLYSTDACSHELRRGRRHHLRQRYHARRDLRSLSFTRAIDGTRQVNMEYSMHQTLTPTRESSINLTAFHQSCANSLQKTASRYWQTCRHLSNNRSVAETSTGIEDRASEPRESDEAVEDGEQDVPQQPSMPRYPETLTRP
jgi:hypothetical protein